MTTEREEQKETFDKLEERSKNLSEMNTTDIIELAYEYRDLAYELDAYDCLDYNEIRDNDEAEVLRLLKVKSISGSNSVLDCIKDEVRKYFIDGISQDRENIVDALSE